MAPPPSDPSALDEDRFAHKSLAQGHPALKATAKAIRRERERRLKEQIASQTEDAGFFLQNICGWTPKVSALGVRFWRRPDGHWFSEPIALYANGYNAPDSSTTPEEPPELPTSLFD